MLDERTDWDEVAELLTDSYCVQAPESLASQVERPGPASS
ncbi:YjbR protein OS=Tsukamurella paurometabola (strain ATCC 8368 / DSM / CCUG 35730 / CIP 100753/ JCM 10117 / KCTC 9821 / NBRC 16120 / NCIMB 702349 / NCTC 13040) OX=521096 GN=Tpau_1755 PE=4 SV=1 [Tsukamurella paurometabola]